MAVVTLNVAKLALAGTRTEAGSASEPVVLERITFAPLARAGLLSVTVQVVFPLAVRLAAAHCRVETTG